MTTGGGISPEMLNEMAGMPDSMRKQMMRGRLEQLLALPDERRLPAVQGLIAAIHDRKVKDSDREKLVATRTEIIGEFSEEKRRGIMVARAQALKEDPDLNKADMELTEKVMPQVPADARKAFMETMSKLQEMSQG